MILSALNAYYRRVAGTDGGPPLYGFDLAKVSGAVHLSRDGTFCGILDLRVSDAKGKARPRLITVPQPPQRTVAIMPAFLCDNAGYLCGADSKGKPERALAQFQAARELHERLLGSVDHPAAKAILAHFAVWRPEDAAGLLEPYADLLDGWLVFKVHGQEEAFAHEAPALRDIWLGEVDAATSDARGQCLATGAEDVPLARLHPAVKGVMGAQSSGASLVSFNIESAVSYGKTQSFNAPVGEAAAFGYAAALNHLLRRDMGQSRTIGDTTLVVWGEKASHAETLLPDILDPFVALLSEAKATDADKLRAAEVRDALDQIVKGKTVPDALKPDAKVRFFILGLAPNAARLSVRFWWSDTLDVLVENVGRHQRDLALITDHPARPPYPSLWALVNETRPKDKDGKAIGGESSKTLHKLYGDLSRAALTGGPYSAALIPVLLARFRSDGHITHPRVALLKAILVRQEKLELPMALDETRSETGYILGRLFAVLERLQLAAHGDRLNTTIRDKFTASASGTPGAVFPYLLKLSGAHFKKARRDRKGLAHKLERQTAALTDRLRELPATLSLTDQGLFFIGYYQQRQALWSKADTDTETDAA
ncbi:MAG: type I-C CRISPR-associated protein Cas8c/Csd1 [Rhodospirillaceae bacterium]